MTDSDIIKALECCYRDSSCEGCQYGRWRNKEGRCIEKMQTDTIALIKRQQAENEQLKVEKDKLIRNYKECAMEAVRDFAGRLKERQIQPEYPWGDLFVTASMIDETVAEMEGKA